MAKHKGNFRTKASNKPLHYRKAISVPYSKVKSRVFQLQPRSVLAFLHPKYMTQEEFSQFIHDAAQDVLKRFGINTIVVGLEHWSEMRILDPEDMNKNGWFHKDQIFLLKSDIKLNQNNPEDLEKIALQYANENLPAPDEEE